MMTFAEFESLLEAKEHLSDDQKTMLSLYKSLQIAKEKEVGDSDYQKNLRDKKIDSIKTEIETLIGGDKSLKSFYEMIKTKERIRVLKEKIRDITNGEKDQESSLKLADARKSLGEEQEKYDRLKDEI